METKLLLVWEFLLIKSMDVTKFIELHGTQINKITQDAFLKSVNFNKRKLKAALKNATYVGLIKNGDELLGFSLLSINVNRRLDDKLVLWINKIAISTNAQGHGMIGRLLGDLQQQMDLPALGFLGCCTQNASLINALSHLGCRSYPITHRYGSPEGVGKWTYLTLNIQQIKERLYKNLDELDELLICTDGILKNGYDKKMNVSQHPLRPEIMQRLSQTTYNQDEGDILILLTEI